MSDQWQKPQLSEAQVRDLDAVLVAWTFGEPGLGLFADGASAVKVSHLLDFVDRAHVLAEYGQTAGMPRTVNIQHPEHIVVLVEMARAVLAEKMAELEWIDVAEVIDHDSAVIASAHKLLAVLEPLMPRS